MDQVRTASRSFVSTLPVPGPVPSCQYGATRPALITLSPLRFRRRRIHKSCRQTRPLRLQRPLALLRAPDVSTAPARRRMKPQLAASPLPTVPATRHPPRPHAQTLQCSPAVGLPHPHDQHIWQVLRVAITSSPICPVRPLPKRNPLSAALPWNDIAATAPLRMRQLAHLVAHPRAVQIRAPAPRPHMTAQLIKRPISRLRSTAEPHRTHKPSSLHNSSLSDEQR